MDDDSYAPVEPHEYPDLEQAFSPVAVYVPLGEDVRAAISDPASPRSEPGLVRDVFRDDTDDPTYAAAAREQEPLRYSAATAPFARAFERRQPFASASDVRFRSLSRSFAPQQRKSNIVLKNALSLGMVAPGQPFPARRAKDKVTPLAPLDGWEDLQPRVAQIAEEEAQPAEAEEEEQDLTSFCIAYELDLGTLREAAAERFGAEHVQCFPEELKLNQTPDILHAVFTDEAGRPCGDVVYFDFGVVVTWNLSSGQEFEAVWQLAAQHATQPIPDPDIEVDELRMHYSPHKTPQLRDDTIIMWRRFRDDVLMKVGVSIALAQSTRISVQETQVMEMVYATRDLPTQLVKSGRVEMEHAALAQMIGAVFLQKSALNLQVLSGQGETPKFFWGRADHLQGMYRAVSDYLEMDERVEVLNTRFQVLTSMLDLLRDQQCTAHEVHLEWIVIFLILITTCLGLLQIASLLGAGWLRQGRQGVRNPVAVAVLGVARLAGLLPEDDSDDAFDALP